MNGSWLDTRWFAITLVSLLLAALLGVSVVAPVFERVEPARDVFTPSTSEPHELPGKDGG